MVNTKKYENFKKYINIKIDDKSVKNFVHDLINDELVTKDKYGYYWHKQYSFGSIFISNYILGENRSPTDFYGGTDETYKYTNFNELVKSIKHEITQQIENSFWDHQYDLELEEQQRKQLRNEIKEKEKVITNKNMERER